MVKSETSAQAMSEKLMQVCTFFSLSPSLLLTQYLIYHCSETSAPAMSKKLTQVYTFLPSPEPPPPPSPPCGLKLLVSAASGPHLRDTLYVYKYIHKHTHTHTHTHTFINMYVCSKFQNRNYKMTMVFCFGDTTVIFVATSRTSYRIYTLTAYTQAALDNGGKDNISVMVVRW